MEDIISAKICPYCGCAPEYVDSVRIYGRSYGMIYLCAACDAYVGVHKGTSNPLGRSANKELRNWKKRAHAYFDVIWQSGYKSRSAAYEMLARHLNLPKEYCHIGMFSAKTCIKVIWWSISQVEVLERQF
ncbi:MAG: hypothetical protein KDD49_03925 [Bacteroidetes bacterium]|nr:hypothetical protein [Bacteroidota bacterium]